MGQRVKPETLVSMKQQGQPIVMLTCYDYPMAVLQDAAEVDIIFVGDSVGTNVLGYESPREVTMEDMLHHTRAVRRGVKDGLLVADMPYGSYDTPELGLKNARRFVSIGAEVVKLEGGREVSEVVRRIVDAGIPVMGHLGFTPQTAEEGSPVVGATAKEAETLYRDALSLEEAGAGSLVLECVPERVSEVIAAALKIPTIGIGSGRTCDGQVLVLPDLLGLSGRELRFTKRYARLGSDATAAIGQYVQEVRERRFPEDRHRFRIKREELRAFRKAVGS